jgi:hypothetical protein
MAGAIDGINNLNTAFEGVMSTLQKSSGGEFIEDSPQGSLDFWRCGRKARGNIRLFGNEIDPAKYEPQLATSSDRSANDSAEEMVLCTSRKHGFLPKAPVQRDRVRKILAPFWADRFLSKESRLSVDGEALSISDTVG